MRTLALSKASTLGDAENIPLLWLHGRFAENRSNLVGSIASTPGYAHEVVVLLSSLQFCLASEVIGSPASPASPTRSILYLSTT